MSTSTLNPNNKKTSLKLSINTNNNFNQSTISTPPIDLNNLPTIQVSSPTSPTMMLAPIDNSYINKKDRSSDIIDSSNIKKNSITMMISKEASNSGNISVEKEKETNTISSNSIVNNSGSSNSASKKKVEEIRKGKSRSNSLNAETTLDSSNLNNNNPGLFSFLPSINFDAFPSISLPSSPTSLLPNFNLSSLLPKLNATNISFLPGGQSDDDLPVRRHKKRNGKTRVGEIIGAGVGEEESGDYTLPEELLVEGGTSSSKVRTGARLKKDRYSMDLRLEQGKISI